MTHFSEHQFQELIDRTLQEDQQQIISKHVDSCFQCMQRVRKLERVERILRRSLLEAAPVQFTENVMKQLTIHEAPSFAWKIFKNLGPVVGLIIIGIIVFAVFKYTGKFNEPGIQSSLQTSQSVYTKIGENLKVGVGVFNNWMRTYLPFAFAGKSIDLTAFISLFFLAIALLDRFFFAPMLRKRKNV